MISKLLTSLFGTKHERDMKKLRPLVEQINALEPTVAKLTDAELQAKTPEFQARIQKGELLDDLLPEAFAVCREASKRVLGMRHYDVQLIGGITLHRGGISEMKTGEGKTLVATLPTYLNALEGRGVHVVTVNDYLAKRDTEWMGRLYSWLGLTSGTITHDLSDEERKVAYGSDITYGTNNEFGFDYLRDNMKFALEDYVQRELNYAIIDECDSILIDEARTPLIISGPKDDATDKYAEINKIVPHLKMDVHYTMEEKSRTASLTDEGNHKVEELLGIGNLFDPENIDFLHHIYQALKATHLYKLDVDYMIKDGEIVIVDEFTGRLMPGRRWSDGLHQAIEAKEGVRIRNENQTLATITFQNYFRMYRKMAGMTGTAETEATEFKKIYNLDVQVIPTNQNISREDHEDVVYKSEAAKYRAMVVDIKERNAKGQPVLVGTVSIEKSERLSRELRSAGVPHNVLNAKHHEREAEIVAQAGRKGGVTIATNMAGRGTDILLGGNAEFMARAEAGHDASEERIAEMSTKYADAREIEKKDVLAAGGLYIMGTERHESRRIDNQLRGRAGRQGDPGESKFYLSLEDNLMRIFNGERIQKIMTTLRVDENEPITARMVSRAIENAQKRVEGHNFDMRKHLIEYDDVMNQQRSAIYTLRRQILAGEEVERKVLDMLSDVTSHVLDTFLPEGGRREDWNIHGLATAVQRNFGLELDEKELANLGAPQITERISQGVKVAYDAQKQSTGDYFEQLARMILLQTIDTRWKEHLERIDRLKEGIHLRAHAQKDPLIEYKKEAFAAFQEMNLWIQQEAIEKLIKVRLVDQDRAREMFEYRQELDSSALSYAGADESAIGFNVTAPAGNAAPPRPSAPSNQVSYVHGPSDDGDEPKLNREQRRRMEKNKKIRR